VNQVLIPDLIVESAGLGHFLRVFGRFRTSLGVR
jgi:hypothetical protein